MKLIILYWPKMGEAGLSPNERAEKHHLLKRVSFDLLGLPPSLEIQEEVFLTTPHQMPMRNW